MAHAIGIGVLAAVFVCWSASAAELVPHRAVYEASLGSTEARSGISGIDGGYAVEMERTCDGWIVSQQLTIRVLTADGRGMAMDARFTAWESHDGRSYRFSIQERLGQQETRFKGEARLDPRGGTARFSVPAEAVIALPAGTLFPVGHLASLIDHAILGETTVSVPLFDGSGGEGPKRVTAFIARPKPPEEGTPELAARSVWPVRLAYFPIDTTAAEPEFEVEAEMADNGVARRVLMDFGDFSVRLKLKSADPLAIPACR